MPEIPYQAVLFTDPAPPDHFFYIVTNMFGYKHGQARDVPARMKKDRQFRGTIIVGKIPCNCPLQRDAKGREYCQREIHWQNAHRSSRNPNGEWNIPSAHVQASLRWMFSDDPRALAVIDRVERNVRGQTA